MFLDRRLIRLNRVRDLVVVDVAVDAICNFIHMLEHDQGAKVTRTYQDLRNVSHKMHVVHQN